MMPGQALLEVTGSAQATLQAALEALGQRDMAGNRREAPSKREVLQLAERVKNDATRGATDAAAGAALRCASACTGLSAPATE